jgi:hypothetical protein
MISVAKEKAFTMILEDDCCSLKEACKSHDWPEWECAIYTELEQLCQMRTWELVKKPVGTVPINNKFIFTKKWNKEGIITKYKAKLVAKGCTQCPGHDYLKTHLPVMWLEIIWAILAIAPMCKLHIQQMDVKGTYLNGMLKECMYTSGKHHLCFFYAFCTFSNFFLKSMKKPSPLLARVFFKLVKKVDHFSKVPQHKKYMLSRKHWLIRRVFYNGSLFQK